MANEKMDLNKASSKRQAQQVTERRRSGTLAKRFWPIDSSSEVPSQVEAGKRLTVRVAELFCVSFSMAM